MTPEEERMMRAALAARGMRNPYTDPRITMESQVADQLRTLDPNNMPGMTQAPDLQPVSSARQEAMKNASMSTAGREAKLASQQAFADHLRGTPMPKGQRVGPSGIYVNNPWDAAGAAFDRAVGGYMSGKLKSEYEDIDRLRGQKTEGEYQLGEMDKRDDRDFTAEENEKDRNLEREMARVDAMIAGAETQAERNEAIQEGEDALRKEFSGLAHTKEFKIVDNSFQRVIESAKPSISGGKERGAGDMALIFNFMKMLDPLSVVRESEYATAARAGEWLVEMEESGIEIPRALAQILIKLKTGGSLTDEQRADFVTRAKMLHNGASRSFDQTYGRYKNIADKRGFDVDTALAVRPTEIDPESLEWLESNYKGNVLDNAGDTVSTEEPVEEAGPPTPQTQEEFDALPKGTEYIDPDDGKRYVKP